MRRVSVSEVKRLRELETESATLKRMCVNPTLEREAILTGKLTVALDVRP